MTHSEEATQVEAYEDHMIAIAVDYLNAVQQEDGRLVYYDAEMQQYYVSDEVAFLDLGKRLDCNEPNAVSLWCTEMGVEVAEDPNR